MTYLFFARAHVPVPAHSASQVLLSYAAFQHLEDFLRSQDKEDIKRNRMREAETKGSLDVRGVADPCAPYRDPDNEQDPQTPYLSGQGDTFTVILRFVCSTEVPSRFLHAAPALQYRQQCDRQLFPS
jgi:hypothetical protein